MNEEVPEPYRRIDELGLAVPVGRELPAGDGTGEIVKTYADCAITAVFFRQPSGSLAFPHVLDPSDIAGGSGGAVGDLHVTRHGPVDPDRDRIKVSFEGFAPWDDGVEIAVDRRRTAPFDRYLAGPAPHREEAGLDLRIVDVRAGLLRAAVELFIAAVDPEILAIQLDRSPFRPHFARGPGEPRLWRDWHPTASSPQRTEIRQQGGRVTAVAGSSFSVAFRRLTPREMAERPPRKDPPPEWSARAQPGGIPLAVQGGSGRGGPPPERAEIQPILYCDPPPETATAIALSLDRLWAYRSDGARASVPAPRADGSVDLAGITLDGEACRVDLIRWEDTEHGFGLEATCDPPECWPDIRVMAADSSASLWAHPPDEAESSFSLPRSYAQLFTGSTIELALRMVARRVEPIAFALPLTPAGEGLIR